VLQLTAPIAGLAGLLTGSIIVFTMPRLAAYRLQEPPPPPPAGVLVPLVGGLISSWRPLWCAAVELVTAVVFVLLALHTGDTRQLPVYCFYSALLIAIATVDIQHRLVLNRLSYPGVVIALAASFLIPGIGIGSALLGTVIAFALFFVIELLGKGAMGPGDTKLATLIGAMTGFPGLFNALLTGVILGGVAAVVYLLVLRRSRKDKFAYGPYLAAGAIIALFIPHMA